jgi:hypothetical protein
MDGIGKALIRNPTVRWGLGCLQSIIGFLSGAFPLSELGLLARLRLVMCMYAYADAVIGVVLVPSTLTDRGESI